MKNYWQNFSEYQDELCDDCKKRIEKNPLRVLDCKVDGDKEFMQDAPNIFTCLCDDCKEHFDKVQKFLQSANVEFELDSRLVRGLDYYTKTAFEIQYTPLGAQSAVAGGGRYDGLVEEIGGSPTPGIGFAAGIERILIALEKQNLLKNSEQKFDAFIVTAGNEAEIFGFEILTKLRRKNISATMDFAKRSIKAQMKQASKSGAKFALIIGEEEVKNSTVTIKNLETSEQKNIYVEELLNGGLE